MNYIEMFLLGHKPAIYGTTLEKLLDHMVFYLKQKYPYIKNNGINLIDEAETYLFFQKEEQKQFFLNQFRQIQSKSPEFHYLLGKTLGYPPKAVQFYKQALLTKKLDQYRVGIYYLGISCSSNIDDLMENCAWLWDTYPFPVGMEIRVDTSFITVKYRDWHILRQIQADVKRKLAASP